MTFSESELAELDAAVAQQYSGGHGATFMKLVEEYRRFVGELVAYNFTIYDYDNDVSVREILDRALQTCSPPLRDKALASLKELDDRFLEATVETKRTHRSEACAFDWHGRLPRVPGPELVEDIESGNY